MPSIAAQGRLLFILILLLGALASPRRDRDGGGRRADTVRTADPAGPAHPGGHAEREAGEAPA